MLTLKEEMALAVLRVAGGDDHAAYALADKLIEERNSPTTPMQETARQIREGNVHSAGDGWGVYRWPEFIEFCRRLGVAWDLRTIDMTITLRVGEAPLITQSYRGSDVDAPMNPVNTTSMQNAVVETHEPPVDPGDVDDG